MITDQLKRYFASQVFRFIGPGGMMGASYFDGQPEQYTAPTVGYAPPDSYISAIKEDAPLAHWRLAEEQSSAFYDMISTARDQVGGADGTYTGGVTQQVTALVDGTLYAADFNGTTDYVSLVDNNLDVVGDVTIEAWFKTSAATAGTLYGKYASSADAGFYLQVASGGAIEFSGRDGNTALYQTQSSAVVNDSRIHYAVGQREAGEWRVYADAILQDSSAVTNGSMSNGNTAEIGRNPDVPGTYFDGTINEVALYSSAITIAAIRRHYAIGRGYGYKTYPHAVVMDGAQYFYRLNETTGSTAYTHVGLSPNGVINGGTVKGGAPLLAGQEASFNFDGSNDRIAVPAIAALTSASYELTIEASVGTSDHRFAGFNAQAPFVLCRYINASTLAFGVNSSASATAVYASSAYKTVPHHYVGTYKQSGAQCLYVNGRLMSSTTAPGAFNNGSTNQNNNIGSDHTGASLWDGDIGECAIFPTQLNASAIREHNALARGFAIGSYPYEVAMDDPVGYWRMSGCDGAVNDSAQGEVGIRTGVYKGTRYAGSSLVTHVSGVASSPACYTSGGSSNTGGIQVHSADFQLFPLTGSHTMETWAKLTPKATYPHFIIGKHTQGSQWPEFTLQAQTTGEIRQVLASAGSANGQNVLETPGTYDDERVHHIVATHDNPNNHRYLYVDGVLRADKAWAADIWNGPSLLTIGYGAGTLTHNVHGAIDETAIYASALSATQVKRHYAIGKGFLENTNPFTVIVDNAVRYYRLDQATASTQYSCVGTNDYLTASNKNAVNWQASAILPSEDYAAYFSATGAASAGNPYIYITSATDDATPMRTLETWFTIADYSENRHPVALYTGASNRMHLRQSTATGKLDVFSGAYSTSIVRGVSSTIIDKVYQAIVTYNGTDTSLYINGQYQDASSVHCGGMDAATELVIGGLNNGSRLGSWVGSIGEVVTYATALTEAQVSSHYVTGTRGTYMRTILDSNPTAYWQLGEDDRGGFDSLASAVSPLTFVRASANVSVMASSIVGNNLGDRSIKFQQTGVGSLTQALLETVDVIADVSAGNPLRTFESWFRIENIANSRHLVSMFLTDSDRMLWRVAASGYIGIFDGVKEVVQSSAVISTGEDHYSAVTYDGTTTRLYFDGELVDSAIDDPGGVGGQRLVVGGYRGTTGKFGSMSGHIDEVAVYTSVLSPQTIRDHYLAGL